MGLNTIWKFPLAIIDRQKISVPAYASFLSIGYDQEDPRIRRACIWAAVDPSSPIREIEIVICGTGHPLPHVGSYIGTLRDGDFIWHFFTGPRDEMQKPNNFHYTTKDNGP